MSSDSVFMGVIFIFVGVGFFLSGFKYYRQKKIIEDTPTSKVRSLAMGRIEISGNIKKYKKIFLSPFSNTECLWCNWTIQEYRKQGKNSRWVIIAKGLKQDCFYLDDGTGEVLVNPQKASISIPPTNIFTNTSRFDQKGLDFLKSKSIKTKGLIFNKNMKYTESLIKPNDKLYILGHAGDNPYVENGTAQHNYEDIMIQWKKGEFFHISNHSENELLKSFKRHIFAGFFFGSILIIIGVILLVARFNLF